MSKLRLFTSIAAAVAAGSLSVPTLYAQSLVHNRIPAISSVQGRFALAETVIPRALRATDLGPAPASTPVESMTLRFALTDAQSVALAQLEAAQQTPGGAQYHQWLTPETYAAEFGLSTDDMARVTSWLSAQGFSGITPSRSRSFITFSGTVGQVSSAFGTQLHSVTSNGQTHFANLTEPSLPRAFSGIVTGLTGLNNFRLRPHVLPHVVPAPQFTSSISGNTFIAPGDFYTIYDINPLLNSSINGSGVTVAVMGQTDIALSDVAAFRKASGLSTNVPTVKVYGTDPGTSTTDLPEASLDVEWSGAVAPSATILYVNSTDVIAGSLTQAIDNNLAPILTISYGNCESGFGSSNIAVYNQLFRQANVQGQTIMGPAGDAGATDCDYNDTSATGGLAVDFPASSPYVTGVGGTMFNENGATYFSTTNGAYQGSAISYIPEAVWNESGLGQGLAAGGGGISAYFTKPGYQTGNGVPNDFSRDVPDVAFNAAASHDGYLFCVSNFCTNGFRNSANSLDVVGGTSVSTPAFAGIMALLQQKIASRVGNANPVIYGLANSSYYGSVFHDITVGNNASPCTQGSTNCPSGGSIGYNAGVGYDLATGWGSVDANNMVNDWLLVSPAGIATVTGTTTSNVALTASASSVQAGTTVTFTAQVSSSNSSVTATPTGSIQLLVDKVPSGTYIPLTGGSATFTLSTTSLSSGGHIISVAYTGDAVYAGSKGSVNLDVYSANQPDFTLSPIPGSISVASGGTGSLTFTVAPIDGFVGPVAFTATVTGNTLNAMGSFAPATVNLTTTASGTTVFTLQAYVSSAKTGTGQIRFGSQVSGLRPVAPAPWEVPASGVAFAGLLFFMLPGRNRSRKLTLVAVALLSVSTLYLAGCSEGGSSTAAVAANTNTAPGTYTLLISASGSNNSTGVLTTHNSYLTVVVH